ncbi:hypothetical protein Tco_0265223 [Tanacetum coccineum]
MLSVTIFVISKPTVLTPFQESPLIATVTTLPPPSVSTTPPVPQQTTTPIPTPPTTTDAQIITTTVSKSDALSAIQLRVAKLEKDMSELKKIDLYAKALAALKIQVPSIVNNYLGSKVGDVFQKELKKHTSDSAPEILKIKREQAEKQQTPKFTIKSTDKEALEEYDLKSAIYQSMHANKSVNRNPTNHRLYHALMEALIKDENAMDKGVNNTIKDHNRKDEDDEDDDDEDPPARPNQGNQTKRRRTKDSESSKKPSSTKETQKGDDVARDDNQSQDTSETKTRKTPNPDWSWHNTFIGYAVTDMKDDVDINTLTMEHHIALIPDDIKPAIVKTKIFDDIKSEINVNFMMELRRKIFTSTDDEDAYEHVRRALRWKNRLPAGTITTWDLLKKEFIWRYCHPFITAKKLKEIRNFKQERDETLFIPLMTPTQAIESIQVMADHSHDWYDETITREIINDALDNVDAIHEIFKGKHLTKEYIMEIMLSGEKVKAITTMGKENMKEPVPRDLSPTPFLGHLKEQMGSPYKTRKIVRMIGNLEKLHIAKAQEDKGDMDIGWDITSKDIERLRQFLTPTVQTLPNLELVVLGLVHDKDKIVRGKKQYYDIPLNDIVVQLLTPQTVHITPPDDDYVASTTNRMSNKQLNKFEEKFSNITTVDKKEYDNPVIKTCDYETFIRKLPHQVSQSSREMKS